MLLFFFVNRLLHILLSGYSASGAGHFSAYDYSDVAFRRFLPEERINPRLSGLDSLPFLVHVR